MNISALIYLLLFIPFIILFAVFGATFMTAGYKKDFGRSLISLGASVTAVIISFFASKLFAWALSKLFGGIISKIVPKDSGVMAGLIEGTAAGVIKIVLSLLLFGTFFAITLGIFKTIFKNHLCGAWLDKLNPRASGSKLGGLRTFCRCAPRCNNALTPALRHYCNGRPACKRDTADVFLTAGGCHLSHERTAGPTRHKLYGYCGRAG